jgi:KDO2-lipid IV(A) lauroyltransferase
LTGLLSVGFGHFTRVLPLPIARALTVSLGALAYVFVPRIRKVGLENLDRVYGDTLTRGEKKRILRASVRNVAIVAAEFSRVPLIAQSPPGRFARIEGLAHLNPDQGFVAVGAHLGNWEWMSAVFATTGREMAAVVRPLDDPALNRYVDGTRRRGKLETVPKDDAGQALAPLLKRGAAVGILVDQCPRDNGAPATFFGHPCWATVGPPLVAMRAHVPMHPVSLTREPAGGYVLRFYPAIELAQTGNTREDLQVTAQRCQDAVEMMIRDCPEQWLWFHRRWKSRPRLQAEWEARVRHSPSK